MSDLKQIAQEIRDEISKYQEKNGLSFVEDTHTYFIKESNGNVTSKMPSVSKVVELFHPHFIAENTRAFQNCEGNPDREQALLKEWSDKGDYATNMGSRVHYILEQELVNQYGNYKEVRQPIFECDDEQVETGNSMIVAGKEFVDLMHQRGAVLLDTEMILGSLELGYFGQPDKVWLMKNGQEEVGIVISDWKSNQPKNFEVHSYTKIMYEPFEYLWDTALSHYYIQLPLYAKLLKKMLEGTKFENVKFFGSVIVLLKKDCTFEEYKVPRGVVDTVMEMNMKQYLK